MKTICKNFEKCPIYSGVLSGKDSTSNSYKKLYCEAGIDGWSKCKRYLVKEKTGKCPPDLLPNSFMDVDAIIKAMSLN